MRMGRSWESTAVFARLEGIRESQHPFRKAVLELQSAGLIQLMGRGVAS